MKKVKSIFYVIAFLYCYSATSQQLVQNISDIYRLKDNETQFINMSLKDLLKEIKPEIKTVLVMNGEGFFYFKFLPIDQLRKEEGSLEDRVSLLIYVKGNLEWKWEERPKNRETIWTKEDVEKYGDLIVRKIGVVSKN